MFCILVVELINSLSGFRYISLYLLRNGDNICWRLFFFFGFPAWNSRATCVVRVNSLFLCRAGGGPGYVPPPLPGISATSLTATKVQVWKQKRVRFWRIRINVYLSAYTSFTLAPNTSWNAPRRWVARRKNTLPFLDKKKKKKYKRGKKCWIWAQT